MVDPEREKEEMDREAERVVKEQEMLAKKQSAAMGRGGYYGGGGEGGSRGGRGDRVYDSDGRRGMGMDGDFLENDEVGFAGWYKPLLTFFLSLDRFGLIQSSKRGFSFRIA